MMDIPGIAGKAREKMIVSSPRVLPSSATLLIECWIVDLLICKTSSSLALATGQFGPQSGFGRPRRNTKIAVRKRMSDLDAKSNKVNPIRNPDFGKAKMW